MRGLVLGCMLDRVFLKLILTRGRKISFGVLDIGS
jgi:hypothetical protein